MTDLLTEVGNIALGIRLKLITAKVTEDAFWIYELYKVELASKWLPVFYALSEKPEASITGNSKDNGHTQPSVSKIVRELRKAEGWESPLK